MAIYDLRCSQGHTFEVIQAFTDPLPDCPSCGEPTVKIPARFAIGKTARIPLPPDAMPQTWRGTYNADREYVTQLRRVADARAKLEERHPELRGDRRPVLAHEGPYQASPLRKGDPAPPSDAVIDRAQSGSHGRPGHGHMRGSGHTDGHGASHHR